MKFSFASGSYEVDIGQQNYYKIADYAEGRRVYVVTDKTVRAMYFPALAATLGYTPDCIALPVGEGAKTWKGAEKIISDLIEKGHNRRSLLIALGGGVTGDLGGFAASVFMRGIDYLQVPTTLLAAVDSSTGGKTGVNFGGLKNYAGAFKQPVGVVVNTEVFSTLPPREITSGMGEIVKTALLDADIFRYLTANLKSIMSLEWPYIDEIVKMCVFLKGGVVMKDERESGIRKTLNAGHTIGHALESADRFRRSHGEYVLSGIFYECNIAERAGIISRKYKNEIQRLVLSVMPNVLPMRDRMAIGNAMRRDKKNEGEGIVFILPTDYGKVQEVRLKEDLWTS